MFTPGTPAGYSHVDLPQYRFKSANQGTRDEEEIMRSSHRAVRPLVVTAAVAVAAMTFTPAANAADANAPDGLASTGANGMLLMSSAALLLLLGGVVLRIRKRAHA